MSHAEGATVAEHGSGGHVHRDDIGSKIGMWLFLFTEVLLFGGMFLLYAVYRFMYQDDFHNAARELSTIMGGFNTAVLLTSSLTMALSISALQNGKKKLCMFFLWVTIAFALTFMVIKYFEWGAKFEHGIYPGSVELSARPEGQIVFFGLYFVMTGLHGVHVIIGAIAIAIVLAFVSRDKVTSTDFIKLENVGLYWHIVDIIWIFLFPLFYLIT